MQQQIVSAPYTHVTQRSAERRVQCSRRATFSLLCKRKPISTRQPHRTQWLPVTSNVSKATVVMRCLA